MNLCLRPASCPYRLYPHDTLCTYGVKQLRFQGFLCDRYTIDEHITVADFCSLFFRLVFTRNLIGRFNQIRHNLIELRGVF